MKLSEISTDRALDVLCELTPLVSNIIEDDEIIKGLDAIMPERADSKEEADNPKQQNLFAAGIRMMGGLGKMAPVLLKTHRGDVYGILSVLNEKPVSEISAQAFTDTIRQIREVLQDTELLIFFKSSAQRVQTE